MSIAVKGARLPRGALECARPRLGRLAALGSSCVMCVVSITYVWMFAVVCVTEQLVAIASAVVRHSAPVVDRTGSRPPKSVS